MRAHELLEKSRGRHIIVSTAKGIPFASTGDMNQLGTALGVLILSVTFLQQG